MRVRFQCEEIAIRLWNSAARFACHPLHTMAETGKYNDLLPCQLSAAPRTVVSENTGCWDQVDKGRGIGLSSLFGSPSLFVHNCKA